MENINSNEQNQQPFNFSPSDIDGALYSLMHIMDEHPEPSENNHPTLQQNNSDVSSIAPNWEECLEFEDFKLQQQKDFERDRLKRFEEHYSIQQIANYHYRDQARVDNEKAWQLAFSCMKMQRLELWIENKLNKDQLAMTQDEYTAAKKQCDNNCNEIQEYISKSTLKLKSMNAKIKHRRASRLAALKQRSKVHQRTEKLIQAQFQCRLDSNEFYSCWLEAQRRQ